MSRHPANVAVDNLDRGGRVADRITSYLGSWRFLGLQTAFCLAWIGYNIAESGFDPFPFILLTLALSLQAAYAAPFILLSQNRAAEHDRARAEHAYMTAEETLRLLRPLVDHLTRETPNR